MILQFFGLLSGFLFVRGLPVCEDDGDVRRGGAVTYRRLEHHGSGRVQGPVGVGASLGSHYFVNLSDGVLFVCGLVKVQVYADKLVERNNGNSYPVLADFEGFDHVFDKIFHSFIVIGFDGAGRIQNECNVCLIATI